MNYIYDIIGWLGMATVVSAFGLNTLKKLHADSLAYILMNGGGSALLIISCHHDGAMPPMVLNIIWLAIALISLWNYLRR